MSGACRHAVRVERLKSAAREFPALGGALAERPLFYWEDPKAGEKMLALGCAHAIEAAGEGRLAEADAQAQRLFAGLEAAGSQALGDALPRLVGGFSFSARHVPAGCWREFPPCVFVLPERLWIARGDSCWLLCCTPCGRARLREPVVGVAAGSATSDPESARARWAERVNAALAAIAAGALRKVVLAHSERFPWDRSPAELAARLRVARPSCVLFWFAPGATHLIGSTPEVLLRLRGGAFQTHALAGTAARGRTAEEDRRQAAALLSLSKDRREHAAVVEGICESVRGQVRGLRVADGPHPELLPEAIHLSTAIWGWAPDATALSLANALHPTPSVCGLPRADALARIEKEEPDRGWYSGALGWIDRSGGVLAVALRSALIDGQSLIAWAGAGIVSGSNPGAEFEETSLKLQPWRAAAAAAPPRCAAVGVPR